MTRHEDAGRPQLKRNALGTASIVFFVVAAAAPLAATLGASPIVFGANGVGGAGAYAVAAVVLLVFAIGYATMAHHVTSAGGFAALIARGLGRPWGFAAAFVALLAYNAMLAGIFGQVGAFAHEIMNDKLGIDLPWEVWVAIGIALVAVLGYNDIRISARVLAVLLIAEVTILLVMDAVILVQGGESGISAAPFYPSNIFSGAAGVAIIFAFGCFIGFEATAVYGEEARNPKRTIPRGTYVAIFVIGGFYVVTMWAISLGYGLDRVTAAAQKDPVNFVFTLNDSFVGSFSTDLMNWVVLTSLFAVVLAFHNTLARYLFSLGRADVLPVRFGETHERSGAPSRASLLQSAITATIVGLFMVFRKDPFFNLFVWLVGLGTLAVLTLMAATSLAVIGFFRSRSQTTVESPWKVLVAPALGCAGLCAAIYLGVHNFDALTGATSGPVTYLPWLIPAAALIGLGVWWVKRENETADVTLGLDETVDAVPEPVAEAL
ncbi:MAG TPA: APC family permease [Vicinamibacterales bacterium]|nr:APC family permease [Vicinamibacterales bacterium]